MSAGSAPRPISIAVTAIGGQGGGVLADWIRDVAEASGYLVQTTSVPGVAQRTGATVYSITLFPRAAAEAAGLEPVLGLMPVPGDVDIVVAAELMEAGRAIQRGYVTPERTLLITSTHRDYAIEEKSGLGDGRRDGDAVLAAAGLAARQLIGFDMERLARLNDSVISAVLLGVLAASAALPIPRELFEQAIRAGGKGVKASLSAFAAGYDQAVSGAPAAPLQPGQVVSPLPAELQQRVQNEIPAAARELAQLGVQRLLDYQDAAYVAHYLERLGSVVAVDHAAPDHALSCAAARHLALWMAFEDTFRVADLKARPERLARVRDEVGAAPGQGLRVTEYLHPRVEEVCDSLPAALGARVLASPLLRGLVERLVGRGRKLRSDTITGYLQLWLLARAGRRWRPRSLRFAREQQRIDVWLETVRELAANDYDLAVELLRCQELVRGYGDTHARGWAAFAQILQSAVELTGRGDAAAQMAALRAAALADERGEQLGEVLVTLERRQPQAAA